ncbi:MAG: tyrosine-type recombinase/integrase [Eggerthellaceae bacterium]|nr:tyrosine-type recombinase/integrase [Eggerthellaceae bacterium]
MKPLLLSDIKRHDDGTFFCRPFLGTNAVDGSQIRPYKRFPEAKTADEAFAMAKEWYSRLTPVGWLATSMRFGDVLERYIDDRSSSWERNTVKTYRTLVHAYIIPTAGGLMVDEVKPRHISALYNALILKGGRSGSGISPNTVITVHRFLCRAFQWIVKNEISPYNPMPSVEPPKPEAHEATAIAAKQFADIRVAIERILADPATDSESIRRRTAAFAAYMALWTGMRVGEVCGCRVQDVHDGMVHVACTAIEADGKVLLRSRTKGGKSRNVSIGEMLGNAVARHLSWQEGFLDDAVLHDRRRAICCTASGAVSRPTKVSGEFKRICADAGITGYSFHSLRHTHATWLLSHGIDMRTIQERLGHANVSTTLALYAHVLPGRDREAADAFEAAVEEMGE